MLSQTSKRYRYTSKERDLETGLYYYGARYYDPFTCRFTGVDPLAGEYAYLSPYNYADNNPVSDKDIDGNQSEKTQTSPGGGGGSIQPPSLTAPADNTRVHLNRPNDQGLPVDDTYDQLKAGLTNVAFGTVSLVGGVALAGGGTVATGGLGAPAAAAGGAMIMMGGLTTMAIGTAQIASAVSKSKTVVPDVGGGAELLGLGFDKALGTDYLQLGGQVIDFAGMAAAGNSFPLLKPVEQARKAFKAGNSLKGGFHSFEAVGDFQSGVSLGSEILNKRPKNK